MPRPSATEYAPYYQTYINYTSGKDYSILVQQYNERIIESWNAIPLEKINYAYAEDKWTIKQMFQHVIDTERIFAYRALRFARNDKTELPGFEENSYVDEANANKRSIQDLLTELLVVRQASLSLFKSFSEEQLLRKGIASNNPMSVRALGFIIIGHQNHHQKVFEERYLL